MYYFLCKAPWADWVNFLHASHAILTRINIFNGTMIQLVFAHAFATFNARQPMMLGYCKSSIALSHRDTVSQEAIMLPEITTFDSRFTHPILCKLCKARNHKSWQNWNGLCMALPCSPCQCKPVSCTQKTELGSSIQNRHTADTYNEETPCRVWGQFRRSQSLSAVMSNGRCRALWGLSAIGHPSAESKARCFGSQCQEPGIECKPFLPVFHCFPFISAKPSIHEMQLSSHRKCQVSQLSGICPLTPRSHSCTSHLIQYVQRLAPTCCA